MKFKYAYGAAPGIAGMEQQELQGKIGTAYENRVSVITLTDPAGLTGTKRAHVKLAADTAAALMIEHFDKLYASDDDVIKKSILDNISEVFHQAGIEGFGAEGAMLFAAVKGGCYIAGHLGGGLIAKLSESCAVLSRPENNLIFEGTDIPARDLIMTNLRIYKGELQEPFGFMLMSDGACQSLFDYGTGNLSPACGTFFEWLKEYDGETVSEALVDNIDKYFKKETNGDISIALMVPDEEEDETGEETAVADLSNEANELETAESYGAPAKERKYLRYIAAVAVIVIAAVVIIFAMKPHASAPEQKEQAKAQPKPPAEEPAEYEPSVTFSVENPVSYNAGEYQIGDDIPPGEYFFWTGDMLEPDSVEINGETCLSRALYCMTIEVGEGDTLTSKYRFTAAENVNPVKATNGTLISGKYKIGKDIAPGEYMVKPAAAGVTGRYYSVFDGEIDNDTEISGDAAVTVPEEGYIVFYDAILVVGKK